MHAAGDLAGRLALRTARSDPTRPVDTAEPGGGATHPLADDALRHQLQLDPARGVEFFEDHRAGTAWEGADDAANSSGGHQGCKPAAPGPGIVGDDGQVARALLDDRLAQRI